MVSHYDGFAPDIAGKPDSMLIPAFSLLINQGAACAAEGNIKIAMTMSVLNTISGTGLYSIDFVEDICIIGHSCGAASPTTDHLCLRRLATRLTAFPFLFLFRKRGNRRCGCAASAAALSVAFRRKRPPLEESAPDQQEKSHPLPGAAYSFL